MFVRPDFQTKAELRQAVKCGEVVTVWSDVPCSCPVDGELIPVSGPRSAVLSQGTARVDVAVWTARVLWKRGKIVLVK